MAGCGLKLVCVALIVSGLGCHKEPTTISGGCGGGKAEQGGVTIVATRSADGFALEVHRYGGGDQPGVSTTYPLTPEEWNELVEIVRDNGLWDWKPESNTVGHCRTCKVTIDDHTASYCGDLEGPDRGAALRSRLESLARAH